MRVLFFEEDYTSHWHKLILEYVYIVVCGKYATVRHVSQKSDITKTDSNSHGVGQSCVSTASSV